MRQPFVIVDITGPGGLLFIIMRLAKPSALYDIPRRGAQAATVILKTSSTRRVSLDRKKGTKVTFRNLDEGQAHV